MSAVMLLGGIIVALYRLVHSNSLGDWRSPAIAGVTAAGMGLFAGLALRAANGFQMQSVRLRACHAPLLVAPTPLPCWSLPSVVSSSWSSCVV
jgi:hypothetical protein